MSYFDPYVIAAYRISWGRQMSGYGQFERILAVLSILFVLAPTTYASAKKSGLRANPPSASPRQRAISSLPPPQQNILNSTFEKTAPVFIFVPGILGSRLSRNVGGQDVPFWGTITIKDLIADNPAFKYTEGEAVTAQVLDTFYFPGKDISVYGNAYEELQSIWPPQSVLRFAYDWRQSNVLSARDFSRWQRKYPKCREGPAHRIPRPQHGRLNPEILA
jgi:hypothetical protein